MFLLCKVFSVHKVQSSQSNISLLGSAAQFVGHLSISEWSSRYFPPSKGPSPIAWTRACFESLRAYLTLCRCLPARWSYVSKHRYANMHMESALQTLRLQGWISMASTLIGTIKSHPRGLLIIFVRRHFYLSASLDSKRRLSGIQEWHLEHGLQK